ncbi:MAG: helix-turn-helix domain-containing protein, partial [Sphingobium sp.]
DVLDFVRHVDGWLCGGVSPEVAALAEMTGLSQRQLERRCKSLYGAPPKLLARKYRALRAAVALVADGATFADVAGRGFYDQSHMIREIKQFTGFTPGQIKAEPTILAQLTIANRHALGDEVHPIISRT